MRKIQQITFIGLLSMAFLLFMVTSCTKEGPAGPPGTDGVDGVDGDDALVSCLECHQSSQIAVIQAQFSSSIHYSGEVAVAYAGGRASCAHCHSHEGFVEYTTNGEVIGDISAPSAWNCATCHGLHTNFDYDDYGFRITEALTFAIDQTVSHDFGAANSCAFCHQSRSAGPDGSSGAEYTIANTRFGPHYGPQSNLMVGMGFAEIQGSTSYPTSIHMHGTVSCTGCHMGEYDASTNQGGHTFNASLKACNECHSSSNFTSFEGAQATVNAKLNTLKDLLIEAGVLEVTNDETGDVQVVTGTFPTEHAQAYFNWKGIKDDRSGGMHNPAYINALLDNSIEALQ